MGERSTLAPALAPPALVCSTLAPSLSSATSLNPLSPQHLLDENNLMSRHISGLIKRYLIPSLTIEVTCLLDSLLVGCQVMIMQLLCESACLISDKKTNTKSSFLSMFPTFCKIFPTFHKCSAFFLNSTSHVFYFFKFSFASVVILFLFAFPQFETVYFLQPEQFCQLWRDAAPIGGLYCSRPGSANCNLLDPVSHSSLT